LVVSAKKMTKLRIMRRKTGEMNRRDLTILWKTDLVFEAIFL